MSWFPEFGRAVADSPDGLAIYIAGHLFRAQSDHRIDQHRAPGGHVTGEGCHCDQSRRHCDKRDRIGSRNRQAEVHVDMTEVGAVFRFPGFGGNQVDIHIAGGRPFGRATPPAGAAAEARAAPIIRGCSEVTCGPRCPENVCW